MDSHSVSFVLVDLDLVEVEWVDGAGGGLRKSVPGAAARDGSGAGPTIRPELHHPRNPGPPTARLRDELIGFYRPRPDDLPAESAGADEIATFLTAHLGWSLLSEEAPPPTTAPSLGDYGRPDRRAERLS